MSVEAKSCKYYVAKNYVRLVTVKRLYGGVREDPTYDPATYVYHKSSIHSMRPLYTVAKNLAYSFALFCTLCPQTPTGSSDALHG